VRWVTDACVSHNAEQVQDIDVSDNEAGDAEDLTNVLHEETDRIMVVSSVKGKCNSTLRHFD